MVRRGMIVVVYKPARLETRVLELVALEKETHAGMPWWRGVRPSGRVVFLYGPAIVNRYTV